MGNSDNETPLLDREFQNPTRGSLDGGETWAARNSGLGNSYVRDLEIHPDSSMVLFAGTEDGFYISANGADSWSSLSDGLSCSKILSLAVSSTGQDIMAGTYWGGTYLSESRNPWQQKVEGMCNTFITDIDVNPVDNSLIQVSSYGRIFRSSDQGTNWNESSSGIQDPDLTSVAIDQLAPDTIYCGAYYGGVYKSIDGGSSWTLMNDGLNSTTVTCVEVDHQNNNIIYAGTYSYLYRSTDGARTWTEKSNGITDRHVWTMEIDPTDPSIVYAGTYGGGIFKSTDSGESWTAINNGLPERYVKAIAVDPSNNDILYAGTYYDGGIYKSTDGGASWSYCSTGLTNRDIWSLDVHPDRPEQVIAGTYGGVFISLDRAGNWENFSDGMDVLDSRCVVYDQAVSRNIFAGTYGGGVYRYDGIYCDVAEQETPHAGDICRLHQNYPNPFNPSTTIKYEIFDRGGVKELYPVSLRIYDVTGKLIDILIDEQQPSGTYSITWQPDLNNRRISSGVYFSRLRVGEEVKNIKLILIK